MEHVEQQFKGFLRLVIRYLKEALAESDPEKKREKLEALLNDLQTTLED